MEKRTIQDATAKEILARLSDLENNPDEIILPYLEINVEDKVYYFTPGGFLYRRAPVTHNAGGFFCGYLADEACGYLSDKVWHYRTDVVPEGAEAPPDGERRSWWRRIFIPE